MKHEINIPNLETLLEEIKGEIEAKVVTIGRKLTREDSLDIFAKHIGTYHDRMLNFAADQITLKVK